MTRYRYTVLPQRASFRDEADLLNWKVRAVPDRSNLGTLCISPGLSSRYSDHGEAIGKWRAYWGHSGQGQDCECGDDRQSRNNIWVQCSSSNASAFPARSLWPVGRRGAPLQTRVAHHVLSRITAPALLSHVRSVGNLLQSRLDDISKGYPDLVAGHIRGRGLMLGLPMTRPEYPGQLVKLARERGVLLLTCGQSTVRFVPSLIISEDEIERICGVVQKVLAAMASSYAR